MAAQFADRPLTQCEREQVKLASVQNKEVQLSEFLKEIVNKSNEDKKKMEEKVSLILILLNHLITTIQAHIA